MLDKSQTICGVSGPVTPVSVTPARQEECFVGFFYSRSMLWGEICYSKYCWPFINKTEHKISILIASVVSSVKGFFCWWTMCVYHQQVVLQWLCDSAGVLLLLLFVFPCWDAPALGRSILSRYLRNILISWKELELPLPGPDWINFEWYFSGHYSSWIPPCLKEFCFSFGFQCLGGIEQHTLIYI